MVLYWPGPRWSILLITSSEYWYDDYEELLEEVVKPSGLSYKAFVDKGYLAGENQFKKYVSTGFKTPSGKVELVLSQAEKFKVSTLPQFVGLPEESDPEYPLVLTSCKSRIHPTGGWRDSESKGHIQRLRFIRIPLQNMVYRMAMK